MLPSPRLFRSRWAALAWAAGILWFAYDVAGSPPADNDARNSATAAPIDAMGQPVTANDLDTLVNALHQ